MPTPQARRIRWLLFVAIAVLLVAVVVLDADVRANNQATLRNRKVGYVNTALACVNHDDSPLPKPLVAACSQPQVRKLTTP